MATLFSLPIWTVRLTFSQDINLVSPLLIPETFTANEASSQLAKTLVHRLEKSKIEQGHYLEMLQQSPALSLQQEQLMIWLPAPRKRFLYPDIALTFDYFSSPLPNQNYLGFIPALGIEGYAQTSTELAAVLQRAIELEFSRKKRLTNVRRLLATQWYETAEVEQHLVETRFYSLSELAHLYKRKDQHWLPEMAHSLPRSMQPKCFGRTKESEQLLRALTGKYTRSILLVGRAGVGKTALIEEVYRQGKNQGLGEVTFWETTAARMLQKLTAETGWEESLGLALEELRQRGDVLYVRNLAQLFEVGAYAGNPISIAEFMREYLALGSVRLISECSDEELATIESRAPGYTNLFQILRIEPPPATQQSAIVNQRLRTSYPNITIQPEAIEETLRLQHRYALYSGFPGKTINFLESLLEQIQKPTISKTPGKFSFIQPPTHSEVQPSEENEEKKEVGINTETALAPHRLPKKLTRETVVARFCEESGMPRFLVDSQTSFELEETRHFFQARLFGQEAAINIIVNLLASVKTRLTRPGKPIASLLFVGPTGVGKTELAKALAEFMFSDSERLIRFDMSEFADEIAMLRLTGDLSGGQGLLTDKIRQQPFSVVLFDELEKAHFAFYDLLLQIMGEGRLTDARGQVADFCSSVIIMTSNIGASKSQARSPGFHNKDRSHNALHQHYLHAVQNFFRPELFNRLDQVIPFNALDLKVLRPIVQRELDKIMRRDGLRTREVQVQIETPVIDYLANLSGDTHYGARQLQRTLHQQIVVPLSTTLNRQAFSTAMKIIVNVGRDGLDFKTMIYTQKARVDQSLNNTKWTLRELTVSATETRRLAQKIDEGPAMNQLWSQWDILERRRRRKEKKFWQDPIASHEYGLLHQLLNEAKQLLRQIENIEIECSLAFMGINPASEQLVNQLLKWQQAHHGWQVRLLDTVQPETRHCVIGIYGASKYLSEMTKIFKYFIEKHEWEIKERIVWIRSNDKEYHYTDHNTSKREDEKIVGGELQITGHGAGLYLTPEEGVHVWIDRDNEEHAYAVIISQTTLKNFNTPQGIHRKKFLEGMEKRRLYWKNSFFDLIESQNYTGVDWYQVLEKQLHEQFQRRLREILCGEETYQDEPELDDALDDIPF